MGNNLCELKFQQRHRLDSALMPEKTQHLEIIEHQDSVAAGTPELPHLDCCKPSRFVLCALGEKSSAQFLNCSFTAV